MALSNQEAWARLSGDRELAPWLAGGQVFDRRPASQHAAVVDDPHDALFRISVEPGGPGADLREVGDEALTAAQAHLSQHS